MAKLKKSEQVKEVKFTGLFDKASEIAEKGGSGQAPAISLSNLQYSTRDEVILPYSHRMDQDSLRKALRDYYSKFVNEIDKKTKEGIKKMLETRHLSAPHKSDWETVCRLVSQEYKAYTIPNHVSNDLFTLFYNPIQKLDFADRTPENLAKYKLIERLNNTVLKVITYSNPVKTMIIIRALITHMLITIVFGKYGEDIQDMEDMQDLTQMLGQKQNPVQQVGMPSPGVGSSGAQGDPFQKVQKQKGNAGVNQAGQQDPSSGSDPGTGSQPSPGTPPAVQAQDLSEDFFDEYEDVSNQSQQQSGGSQPGQTQNPASQAPAPQPANNAPSSIPDLDDEDDEGIPDDEDGDDIEYDEDGNPIMDDYDVQQNNGKSTGAGSGNTDIGSVDDQLSKIMTRMYDDPVNKKMLDKAIDGARDTVESIEELMTEENMREMWEDLNIDKTDLLERINPTKLRKLEEELTKLKVNAKGLKDKIKHLLDKSISYFSAREEPFFENILESDSVSDLIDWALLHPKLRVIMMEDIMCRNSKKIGKINGYVDISGSMDSSCGYLDERGHAVTCATLAKAITLAVKKMDLLDQLYTFEHSVHPTGNQLIDVLLMDGGGGTSLNNVVEHIAAGTQNGLVITDACDRVSIYSRKAFFIGVEGARFSSFDKDVLRKYIDAGQIIIFDGKDVLRVDYNGYVIPKGETSSGVEVEDEEEDYY